jgi:release factor glutamine methyltransferase
MVHKKMQAAVTALQTQYPFEEAQSIAWELLRHVTHKSRIQLLMEKEGVSDEQAEMLMQLIQKHLNDHVPIAYLTGEVLFGDLTILIRPPILIPRSETESWCYELIELLEPLHDENLRILDLCTGSGCIALALAHALPQATVVGVDNDPAAIALAEENKERLVIKNCSFIHSDLFEAIDAKTFDIIVSNPPYIDIEERASLAPSVRNFESPQALFADDHGYAIIKKIIIEAPQHLRYNAALAATSIPQLLIEVGHTQADTVKAFMNSHHYATIQLWKDYQGHNRVVCARVSDDSQSTKS